MASAASMRALAAALASGGFSAGFRVCAAALAGGWALGGFETGAGGGACEQQAP